MENAETFFVEFEKALLFRMKADWVVRYSLNLFCATEFAETKWGSIIACNSCVCCRKEDTPNGSYFRHLLVTMHVDG